MNGYQSWVSHKDSFTYTKNNRNHTPIPTNLHPILPNHLGNHPMILMLLQPTHNNHPNHPIHALHPNRNRPPVDRILPRLTRPQAKLARKHRLVARVLLAQEPRAHAEPQHGRPLALHPALVVGRDPRARGDLEERLRAGAVADGDER